MDLHGGTASVISGEGRRTTFRLWFPGPGGESAGVDRAEVRADTLAAARVPVART